MEHWTERVYQTHGRLLYDVEGALFKNEDLTDYEIDMLRKCARRTGGSISPPVLDLACGPGRHAWRLVGERLSVTGVDFSEPLLQIGLSAIHENEHDGSRPRFVRADIRSLPVKGGSFNTAMVLGNSFGYFSDEENLGVLREAHRVLAKGGFLCLEITDREAYLPSLQSFEVERIDSSELGELDSKWWKRWDPRCQRVRTREQHSTRATGTILYEGCYDVRLYGREEMEEMLEQTGFRTVCCLAASPEKLELQEGLGETLGSMAKVLFVGAIK
ncbi:MAG TPA: class I SAM-dependent methyltransferase [Vicinamibacteria bacterium]|nr:class I SAM-dependent methyltransferase [Vicinamibacteria bacterium]